MKLKVIKGFTLIELLVVITIIGILATGAVQVFTSQIQKARDATRISDLTTLRGWLEQAYQNWWSYPTKANLVSELVVFVPRLPADPKKEEWSNNSVFDYLYNVWADTNGISNQIFEVSTHLENTANLTSQAAQDWWDDEFRLEFWISIDTLDTSVATSATADWIADTVNTWECIEPARTTAACTAALPALIRGNP